MARASAWLLNFDAEEELARPEGYCPSRAVLARFAPLADRVRALLRPGDVVLSEGQSLPAGARLTGMAWCPTPRARRALERAGALLPPLPAPEVLRAVNHRRFSAELGQTLPGARYAFTLTDVLAALEGPCPGSIWLLKRPLSFAGRGRIKVSLDRPGDLAHARAWIEASLRSGEGLQVEPLVERLGDFALHGFVRRGGDVVLGQPTVQECDEAGAWSGSARAAASDLAAAERESLFEEARLAATALHRAGYFGPFGVDAFRYRAQGGEPQFNPRCEINARYSMGWAVGMGDLRPDLEDEP